MAKFSIKVSPEVKLDPLKLSRHSFWQPVADVVEAGIIDNVLSQRQDSGAPLKRNAPSTLRTKSRYGRGARSLIDKEHRFVRGAKGSWRVVEWLPGNTGFVMGGATDELRKLVQWVGKKGYRGYIGVSKHTAAAIDKIVAKAMERWLKGKR